MNAIRTSFIIPAAVVIMLLNGCARETVQCPECPKKDAKIEQLRNEVDKLKSKQGYLMVGTWVAVLSAFCLLAVGVAIGVKIKRNIITLKDVKRVGEDDDI